MGWARLGAGWVLTLALVCAPAGADPLPAAGRCPDGRTWTAPAADRASMHALINQTREHSGLPPLARVEALERMAQSHSVDMACRDFFSHTNRQRQGIEKRYFAVNGRDPGDWQRLGEVLGTSDNPSRQVAVWLGSRSHHRAMFERDYEGIGVGLVRVGKGSRYSTYWTVDFIEPRRPTR